MDGDFFEVYSSGASVVVRFFVNVKGTEDHDLKMPENISDHVSPSCSLSLALEGLCSS